MRASLPAPCQQLRKGWRDNRRVCLYIPVPRIKVSWFCFFIWFCTQGTTLLYKIAFPLCGEKPRSPHSFVFYWVHDKLSTEIARGNLLTLYRPKSPRSRSTFRALTLGPVVISPATCRRIFTISSGLVKMTWEPPAYRQGGEETEACFQIRDQLECYQAKSRKPLHGTTLLLPLLRGTRVPHFGRC